MSAKNEQFLFQGKINFEGHFDRMSSIGVQTIEGMQKILSLQFDFIGKELQASCDFKSKLYQIKSPQDLLSKWSEITLAGRPSIEKLVRLSTDLIAVCLNNQVEFYSSNIKSAASLPLDTAAVSSIPTEKPVSISKSAAEKRAISPTPALEQTPVEAAHAKKVVSVIKKNVAPKKPIQENSPVKKVVNSEKSATTKPFPKSAFIEALSQPGLATSTPAKPQVTVPRSATLPEETSTMPDVPIKSALAIVKASEPVVIGELSNVPVKK